MSRECGAPHPEDISITCCLPPGLHPDHLGGLPPDVVIWPNGTFIPQAEGDTFVVFRDIVRRVKQTGDEDLDTDL